MSTSIKDVVFKDDWILQYDPNYQPGQGGQSDKHITLGRFRQLFERCHTSKAMKKACPEISSATIALGRAFLIASDPDSYRAINNLTDNQYTMLVDECIDKTHLAMFVSKLGADPSHTYFEELNGKGESGDGDIEVYQWAINNNADAILTADRKGINPRMGGRPDFDLAAIAYEEARKIIAQIEERPKGVVTLSDLPVVVAFRPSRNSNDSEMAQVAQLCEKHADIIKSYLENRSTPCIEVSSGGVKVYQTYTEMYADMQRMNSDRDRIIEEKHRWIKRWRKEILSGIPRSERSVEVLEDIDAYIKAAAAMRYPDIRAIMEQDEDSCSNDNGADTHHHASPNTVPRAPDDDAIFLG